jgi:hypothetical protein
MGGTAGDDNTVALHLRDGVYEETPFISAMRALVSVSSVTLVWLI